MAIAPYDVVAQLRRGERDADHAKAKARGLSRGGHVPMGDLSAWLNSREHTIAVARAAARAIYAYADAQPVAPLPEYDVAALRAGLREHLDLRPASKTSLLELRPTFPATLADLLHGPRQSNPAPLFPKDARGYNYVPGGSQIAHRLGIPDDRALYDAYEAEAWQLSAPEGMPPIPRKGGRYSEQEATVIRVWLADEWPVIREWKIRCERASRRLILAGVDTTIVAGQRSGARDNPILEILGPQERVSAMYYPPGGEHSDRHPYLSAYDLTPREFVANVYRWGEYIRPTIAAIETLSDPSLYLDSAGDLDKVDAVWARLTAASEGVDVGMLRLHWLDNIAGMSGWDRMKIAGSTRDERIRTLVEYKEILPSEGIREIRRQKEEYERDTRERERVAEAERATLVRAFAGLGVWTGRNTSRLLPRGFSVEPAGSRSSDRSEVVIVTPSGRRFSESGADRDAAWQELQKKLTGDK